MKHFRILCFPLLLLAASASQAATVYSFQLDDGTTGQPIFGFQFTTPAYLTVGQAYNYSSDFGPNRLDQEFFEGSHQGESIHTLSLYQSIRNDNGFPFGVVFLDLGIDRPFNQGPYFPSFALFSINPNQPGVYLDRDGAYTLSGSQVIVTPAFQPTGPVHLSVTSTPEPATWTLAGLAGAGLFVARRRIHGC